MKVKKTSGNTNNITVAQYDLFNKAVSVGGKW
jgi:hypothetical protein